MISLIYTNATRNLTWYVYATIYGSVSSTLVKHATGYTTPSTHMRLPAEASLSDPLHAASTDLNNAIKHKAVGRQKPLPLELTFVLMVIYAQSADDARTNSCTSDRYTYEGIYEGALVGHLAQLTGHGRRREFGRDACVCQPSISAARGVGINLQRLFKNTNA